MRACAKYCLYVAYRLDAYVGLNPETYAHHLNFLNNQMLSFLPEQNRVNLALELQQQTFCLFLKSRELLQIDVHERIVWSRNVACVVFPALHTLFRPASAMTAGMEVARYRK